MKKLLKQLERHTKNRFAEVRDTGTYFVSNDKRIPTKHIIYEKPNGFYRLCRYICGGKGSGCAIGKPAQKCIEMRIVNRNCGKYALEKINNQELDIKSIVAIIEAFDGDIDYKKYEKYYK